MTNENDPSSRYRRLAERFTDVVDAVPADAWANDSPCDGWNVRDVLRHVADTEREFMERMDFGSDIEPSDDPIADWRTVNRAMQDALDDPAKADHGYDGYFGPTTFAETVDTFYAGDLLVHRWDIAHGAGLTDLEQLDESDLDDARRRLEPLGDNVRAPGVFGPPLDAGPDATEQERFLAWVGRRV
jgi:uncharacterized protein (TIGR03086 family)